MSAYCAKHFCKYSLIYDWEILLFCNTLWQLNEKGFSIKTWVSLNLVGFRRWLINVRWGHRAKCFSQPSRWPIYVENISYVCTKSYVCWVEVLRSPCGYIPSFWAHPFISHRVLSVLHTVSSFILIISPHLFSDSSPYCLIQRRLANINSRTGKAEVILQPVDSTHH